MFFRFGVSLMVNENLTWANNMVLAYIYLKTDNKMEHSFKISLQPRQTFKNVDVCSKNVFHSNRLHLPEQLGQSWIVKSLILYKAYDLGWEIWGSLTQVWNYSKIKQCTMKTLPRAWDRQAGVCSRIHTHTREGRREWHCLVKSSKISRWKEDGLLRNLLQMIRMREN